MWIFSVAFLLSPSTLHCSFLDLFRSSKLTRRMRHRYNKLRHDKKAARKTLPVVNSHRRTFLSLVSFLLPATLPSVVLVVLVALVVHMATGLVLKVASLVAQVLSLVLADPQAHLACRLLHSERLLVGSRLVKAFPISLRAHSRLTCQLALLA